MKKLPRKSILLALLVLIGAGAIACSGGDEGMGKKQEKAPSEVVK
jgi:hypothetical protein